MWLFFCAPFSQNRDGKVCNIHNKCNILFTKELDAFLPATSCNNPQQSCPLATIRGILQQNIGFVAKSVLSILLQINEIEITFVCCVCCCSKGVSCARIIYYSLWYRKIQWPIGTSLVSHGHRMLHFPCSSNNPLSHICHARCGIKGFCLSASLIQPSRKLSQ